jgi:hypothetical protein
MGLKSKDAFQVCLRKKFQDHLNLSACLLIYIEKEIEKCVKD